MSDHQERRINPWIIAVAVMFATFMEVLDTTVVNVSLPQIAGSLSATVDEATWTITSYLVANAIILPMTGWLASVFGRKNLLLWSVSGFTIASFCCGLAPNLSSLIAFRIVQGMTGSVMQPLSQAILLESFAPKDRGRAMAFWALGIVVAPILGPVLGGFLTDSYSWRWVFYINVPVGIASLVMTQRFIFDPPYMRKFSGRIDYWGIGMLAIGIGTLQYVLDKGQQEDWFSSNVIVVLSIVSVFVLGLLIVHEWTAEHPIVDLKVFKERTYAIGVFLMMIVGFGLYGSMVLLPILLQTLLGYPALQAGIAMAPRGLGAFLMMPIVGILTGRVDPRRLLFTGLTITGLTMFWLGHSSLDTGYWDVFWPQFTQGVGMSLLFVPLTTTTMASIAPERMNNATSLFNLMRNIGGSIGIAVSGTMLARNRQSVGSVLGEHLTLLDESTRTTIDQIAAGLAAAGVDLTTATERSYAALNGLLARQAAMVSFVTVFRSLGVLFFLFLPLVLLMKRPTGRSVPPGGAH